MKYYYFLLVALLVTGTGYKNMSPRKQATQRPNIILILADDMGFSDIGCYGGEIRTPNIDGLASEGIRFTRMYNNALCSPSRASLLTGLYPQQVGLAILAGPHPGPPGPYEGYINDQCVTLAEVLKQAGYNTALSGKWHLGEFKPHWPVNRGFDHYFGLISGAANYYDITKTKSPAVTRYMALDDQLYTPPKKGFYMTDAITHHAVDMLDAEQKQDKPFFLYVAYTAPHWPLQAPEKDIAKYAGKYNMGWDTLRVLRYKKERQLGILGNESPLSTRDPEVHAWDTVSPTRKVEMAAKMAVYAAQVDHMDQGIGKILDELHKSGKEKNTIVIFLSDNGACAETGIWGFDRRKNGLPPGGVDSYMSYGQSWANASNTPFRYFKRWLHEGGISTPLIIRWPAGIAANRNGQIIKQVAHLVDMMPTICDLSGAVYPATFHGNKILPEEGQSLVPEIEQSVVEPHNPLYWALNGHKAILIGDYKLEATGDTAPWELYNVTIDRSELHDLAAKDPERVKMMAAKWKTWATKVGVFDDQTRNPGE